MRKTLSFSHGYAIDADRLFALVSDLDTLDAISEPLLRFHHLPSGPVFEGQIIDIGLSVCCVLPERPYKMQVVALDPNARRLRTEESGLGVRRIVHEVEVRGETDRSVLQQRLEIEAGALTPLIAAFAWVIHQWQHHRRRILLAAVVPDL
jgi:hypothetical protein